MPQVLWAKVSPIVVLLIVPVPSCYQGSISVVRTDAGHRTYRTEKTTIITVDIYNFIDSYFRATSRTASFEELSSQRSYARCSGTMAYVCKIAGVPGSSAAVSFLISIALLFSIVRCGDSLSSENQVEQRRAQLKILRALK